MLSVEPVPLASGSDGVLRIQGSRVPFDSVIDSFIHGSTAEEIAFQFPSLALADVYQLTGYYLHHTAELDAYLSRRREQSESVRRDNELRWSPDGVRARLRARRRP